MIKKTTRQHTTWLQLVRSSLHAVMWGYGDVVRKRYKSGATRLCKHEHWNDNQIDITDTYTVQYLIVRYNSI